MPYYLADPDDGTSVEIPDLSEDGQNWSAYREKVERVIEGLGLEDYLSRAVSDPESELVAVAKYIINSATPNTVYLHLLRLETACAYWTHLTKRFEKVEKRSRKPQVEKANRGRRRQHERDTRNSARVDVKGWRVSGRRTANGDGAGMETQRAVTVRPQEPTTASRQVYEETVDVVNPNATCAGPTRPTGASCNPADNPLER